MQPLQTVCPHCQAVNRADGQRLSDSPQCGKCHLPLFTGHPLELDDNSFARYIEKEQLPVIADFWAAWCGPCKAMAPVFESVAAATEPRARFVKVNTEVALRTAQQYGIRSIPTFMVFRHGRLAAQQAGGMPAVQFQQWVNAQIA